MGLEKAIQISGRYALASIVLILGVFIFLTNLSNLITLITGGLLMFIGVMLVISIIIQDIFIRIRESEIKAHKEIGYTWRRHIT